MISADLVPSPATHDPLELALLALVALLYIVQALLRRRKNGYEATGFTAETAGQIKQKVETLEDEVERFRNWRHDHINENISWGSTFATRQDLDGLRGESERERARIWEELKALRARRG